MSKIISPHYKNEDVYVASDYKTFCMPSSALIIVETVTASLNKTVCLTDKQKIFCMCYIISDSDCKGGKTSYDAF